MDAERTELVYQTVRRVPRGRVATYGQIAKLIGMPRHSRHVGAALRKLPEGSRVPWHRIVNSRGEIAKRASDSRKEGGAPDSESLQRWLLVDEGVEFAPNGTIPLKRYQWRPRAT